MLQNPLFNIQQKTKVQQIIESLLERNIKKISISSPTGTGKTLAGVYFIYKINQPAIIITTRLSIVHQWEFVLNQYIINKNDISIATSIDIFNQELIDKAYIIICTPYKLYNLQKKYNLQKYSTIVLDEIQNLLTQKKQFLYNNFIKNSDPTIKLYFSNILALTATNPQKGTIEFNLFKTIFNKRYFIKNDKLLNIPIYYSEIISNYKLKELQFTDIEDNLTAYIINNYFINKLHTIGKILITTQFIKHSIFEMFKILYYLSYNELFNYKILLLRSNNNDSYIITPCDINCVTYFIKKYLKKINTIINIYHIKYKYDLLRKKTYYDDNIDLNDILKITFHQYSNEFLKKFSFENEFKKILLHYNNIVLVKSNEILQSLSNVKVIISTNQKIQEGFNCEELVFGIYYSFPYNYNTRVQLLGRLRRMNSTNNSFLQTQNRIAICIITKTKKKNLIDTIQRFLLNNKNKYECDFNDIFNLSSIEDIDKLKLSDDLKNQISVLIKNTYDEDIENNILLQNNCIKINKLEDLKLKI